MPHMNLTEGLLIVIVLVLAFLVVRDMMAKPKPNAPAVLYAASNAGNVYATNAVTKPVVAPTASGGAAPIAAPAVVGAPEGLRGTNYEQAAQQKLRENTEYFSACGEDNAASQVLDCVCGDKPDVSFAKFDYGAANMDYKEYVASQAVDDKVVENHLQFVRDRKGLGPEGEFITGRTYSPDSHDSYDPVPWVGIRGRPQAVEQCNPTQVPDLDTNLFKGHRPYCFWT